MEMKGKNIVPSSHHSCPSILQVHSSTKPEHDQNNPRSKPDSPFQIRLSVSSTPTKPPQSPSSLYVPSPFNTSNSLPQTKAATQSLPTQNSLSSTPSPKKPATSTHPLFSSYNQKPPREG
ncbi:hypothetical protein FRC03_006125 [Tulasnella sp. 419]|nr:hypothetical protein FRC03_006125 [Tulasnella sp. 419]